MQEYMMNRAGLDDPREARRLLERTLRVFARSLTPSEAARLGHELPSEASDWVGTVEHGTPFEPEELYRRVQSHTKTPLGVVVEQAQVALQAMARELNPETREWIAHRMGESWAPLFELDTRVRAVSRARPEHDTESHARTLSEGRTGSSSPLSSSAPRPQSGSVLEDNPHGERKVSSAEDLSAEPLSSSDPRSKHPLSEGKLGSE
jgi:uncharacterized protein (DUF2267 family)